MFKNLSLRSRFLIAPVIALLVLLALLYNSNNIIQAQSDIFIELKETNLPQISALSDISIKLSNVHSTLNKTLLNNQETANEEMVYVKGRLILNKLHDIEAQAIQLLKNNTKSDPSIKTILLALNSYKEAVINAIELSSVNTQRAITELITSEKHLTKLNQLLLISSQQNIIKLNVSDALLDASIKEQQDINTIALLLLIFMIISALYISHKMSADFELVYQAIITLSQDDKKIKLPTNPDNHLFKIIQSIQYFQGVLIDNDHQRSALTKTLSHLKSSEDRFSSVIDLVPTGIITIDESQNIIIFNQGAEKIFGFDSSEMIGKSINFLVDGTQVQNHSEKIHHFCTHNTNSLQVMNREPIKTHKKDGSVIYLDIGLSTLSGEKNTITTAAITDVTERKAQEDKILHQANFDNLTNLPNRFLSLKRLNQLILETQRSHQLVAVLFLDLDAFKKVNDSLGHDVGDKLLVQAAERLSSTLSSGDTVGRLGGDEFIILLGGLKSLLDTQPIVENILKRFREPFNIDNRSLILTLSIGVALYPNNGADSTELLKQADSAMYHSKRLGRNRYSFYTEEMNKGVERRLLLEENIHQALEQEEYEILYQPKIDVKSGKIISAEALLRWNSPKLGYIRPDEFISILEQTGLIIPVGEFVLQQALKQTHEWQQLQPEFSMAVNLSPVQFRDATLVKKIKQYIKQEHISYQSLELEITEGVLMSGHAYTEKALLDIHKLGIKIAMDDFGTGYSSLSYLRQYPFDTLKIDQSFIQAIHKGQQDKALIKAAVSMAHSLNLCVVAEGVEDKDQLDFLRSIHCDIVQGYYFSKPIKHDEFQQKLLQQNQ